MPPVFAHGRLRLYLLKLLDEAPRHGYEVIRLLEERFQGLYAPSAGTVYPRLAKLEAEGLVTHATEGGRKVYSITEAGRAELADRSGELADLELEIRESVSELAAEIRDDVRGAADGLRREMRAAASASQSAAPEGEDAWAAAKEELRRARQEWKEQTRRAKDESRRAREEAQRARRQAREAQDKAREDVQRLVGQLQDQFGRSGLTRSGLSDFTDKLGAWLGGVDPSAPPAPTPSDPTVGSKPTGGPEPTVTRDPGAVAAWAADLPSTGEPARDLDRLLDRFRDEVRDAARDHGVTPTQLTQARHHLAAAAEALNETLGGGKQERGAAPGNA
ncbi:helix-turn-helix transcriptional regulator [Streptomyces sp. NPDC089799]|uniref:helix-turn-helix transcriptional regulator n=1 Tax=Streptomyces sp. NPDC089799 TaxID=3155066 RepID=UPI00341B75BE